MTNTACRFIGIPQPHQPRKLGVPHYILREVIASPTMTCLALHAFQPSLPRWRVTLKTGLILSIDANEPPCRPCMRAFMPLLMLGCMATSARQGTDLLARSLCPRRQSKDYNRYTESQWQERTHQHSSSRSAHRKSNRTASGLRSTTSLPQWKRG